MLRIDSWICEVACAQATCLFGGFLSTQTSRLRSSGEKQQEATAAVGGQKMGCTRATAQVWRLVTTSTGLAGCGETLCACEGARQAEDQEEPRAKRAERHNRIRCNAAHSDHM